MALIKETKQSQDQTRNEQTLQSPVPNFFN